jgi:hypothetical protein
MCPAALTLPPCQVGLRPCHVSSGFEPHLPAREGSGAAMCTMALDPASLLGRALEPPRGQRLRTLPPCREGSSAATHPAIPCGLRASSIKKNIAGLSKQLGSLVSKAHMHVFKASDIGAIMGARRAGGWCIKCLQDVRTSGYSAATELRRPC